MQTLQNLVDSLSRRLHCAVSLDDRPLQMMFHSCLYGRLDEARIRRMLSPDRGPEPAVTQYIRGCVREAAPISSPLRIPPNPDLGVESRLFMPIRVVTTGQTHGPELQESISLLGRDKVIRRVSAYAG